MDDVLLMADDPTMPAGDEDEDEGPGNPAAGAACGGEVHWTWQECGCGV
jgi:hypothetical protein